MCSLTPICLQAVEIAKSYMACHSEKKEIFGAVPRQVSINRTSPQPTETRGFRVIALLKNIQKSKI